MERMLEYVFILSSLAIAVTCITSYCVVVIVLSKRYRKPSDIAVVSLLVSHFLQDVLVIPTYALKKTHIQPQNALCTLFRFSYMLTNYTSCLSLLVMTLDRFFAVKCPLRYKVSGSPKRILSMVAAVWVYVLVLCAIPFQNKTKKCSYNPNKAWTSVMLILNTLVPFLVILTLYIMVFKKVKAVIRKNSSRLTNAKQASNQLTKSVFVIILCYVLCWGPSCLYYLLLSLCGRCFSKSYLASSVEDAITFSMKLLTFVDGILAPLVYCCINKRFLTASKSIGARWTVRKTTDSIIHISNSDNKRKQNVNLCTP